MSDSSDVSFNMNTNRPGSSSPDSWPERLPPELLDKYLAGSASLDERAAVEHWLNSRPENSALFQVLSTMNVAGEPELASLDAHRSADWAHIKEQIVNAPAPRRKEAISLPWKGIALGAAAAVLLPLLMVPALREYFFHKSKQEPVSYATRVGQTLRNEIAPGIVMIMAPGSSSTLLNEEDKYELAINGEAVFTIDTDVSQVPFIVRTEDAEAKVLGTRFSVRAFKGERDIRVVVSEGKVSVSRDTVHETLSKGDVVRISSNGSKTLQHNRQAERYMRFTSGRLAFVNAPLDEVAADISRWYGVNMQLADPDLNDEHFTGNFGQAEGLDFVLHALEATMPVIIEKQGSTYFLRWSKAYKKTKR